MFGTGKGKAVEPSPTHIPPEEAEAWALDSALIRWRDQTANAGKPLNIRLAYATALRDLVTRIVSDRLSETIEELEVLIPDPEAVAERERQQLQNIEKRKSAVQDSTTTSTSSSSSSSTSNTPVSVAAMAAAAAFGARPTLTTSTSMPSSVTSSLIIPPAGPASTSILPTATPDASLSTPAQTPTTPTTDTTDSTSKSSQPPSATAVSLPSSPSLSPATSGMFTLVFAGFSLSFSFSLLCQNDF
jgi:hypothetical protein